MTVEEQEHVFGRKKADSARLEKQPDFSHLSHVELREGATADDTKPKRDEFVRRSTPYALHDGTVGLYFMAFCKTQAPIRERLRAMYAVDGGVRDRLVDFSNPLEALRPETATGWEVGIDQDFTDIIGHDVRGSVTYFDRHTHDLIGFFSCFGVVSPACTLRASAGGYYFNVNRANASGVEASSEGQPVDHLDATMNYTNLTAYDATTHFPLARKPNSSANAV
jgi:hypothetical protein